MKRFMAMLFCAGCAASPRFMDRPAVWKVDDAQDVPEQPKERKYRKLVYFGNIFLFRRAIRVFQLRTKKSARNTNAWDEVPNSTWFTNRIGTHEMTIEEAARGPIDGPDPVLPLLVVAGKTGGGNPGFVARDATGREFLVKFDRKENPEMQTASDTIGSRIFHAIGYNVPKVRVFDFCPHDVAIADDATAKNERDQNEPITHERLDYIYASVARKADGCLRALASEILPGTAIGGAVSEGVRKDDPNDRVRHEHRRELRGLSVIAAWLNHTDMKEDNTLDMYEEDGDRHFVRHYLVDFGEAFGGHAAENGRYEDGYEHFWDWQRQPLAFLSFGLWVRPWERLEETKWPAIGAFTHEHFDPEDWREAYPYWPFMEADAADRYWGAKMVMRFSKEMLRAIVAEGELSDPEASEYLTNALYERARSVGRAYVEAVTPLDWFRMQSDRICMVDLGVRFGLAREGVVEVLNDGEVMSQHPLDREGRVCVPLPASEAYSVMELRTKRGDDVRRPIELHVKSGRLLGVVRI